MRSFPPWTRSFLYVHMTKRWHASRAYKTTFLSSEIHTLLGRQRSPIDNLSTNEAGRPAAKQRARPRRGAVLSRPNGPGWGGRFLPRHRSRSKRPVRHGCRPGYPLGSAPAGPGGPGHCRPGRRGARARNRLPDPSAARRGRRRVAAPPAGVRIAVCTAVLEPLCWRHCCARCDD